MKYKELEIIYEQSKAKSTDYLLCENVENFNWSEFWKYYFFCEQNYSPLYESFEKISSSKKSDEYKVTTTNGLNYRVFINYKSKDMVEGWVLSALVSNLNDKSKILELKSAIDNTKYPIMNINFIDEYENVHTTNNVGNYAFSVISGVRRAIVDSMYNNGNISPDVVFFVVRKGETKKIELFKNAFKHLFGKINDTYTDTKHKDDEILFFFNNNI